MEIDDLEISGRVVYEGEVYVINNVSYSNESIVLRNLNTDEIISISFDDADDLEESD